MKYKFRAWLIKEKRWADSVTVFGDGSFSVSIKRGDFTEEGDGEGQAVLSIFTGRKDKHGTEVYTGDIVMPKEKVGMREFNPITGKVEPLEVYWDEEELQLRLRNRRNRFTRELEFIDFVIGTVFETPELLDPKVRKFTP